MPDQPLQEAIAKAEAILALHRGIYHPPVCQRCGLMSPCQTFTEANAILDALGVLRADDDTRYVAITKQQRNALGSVCSARGNPSHAMRDAAWSIASAYDAVAPNAKDHA